MPSRMIAVAIGTAQKYDLSSKSNNLLGIDVGAPFWSISQQLKFFATFLNCTLISESLNGLARIFY